jgi:transposase
VGFFLTGGQAHDLEGADHFLPSMQADTLIADKAFDADARVIAPLAAAGKATVIPSKANRQSPREFDREVYKERHLIGNFFAKLKQFRAPGLRPRGFSLLVSASFRAACPGGSSRTAPCPAAW